MSVDKLIKGLNDDLSGEWGTIMRYTYQSSQAVGLRGAELRNILSAEIQDEIGHATFLSDAIADLGGDPTTKPRAFDKPDDLKAMLELDLAFEEEDVQSYREHAEIAGDLGKMELKVKLEDMAADEDGHARELRRLIRGL